MKKIIQIITALIITCVLSVSVFCAETIIQPSQASQYVTKQVVIEGKVLRVGESKSGDTFFLNFSNKPGDFSVVIFSVAVKTFKNGSSDIKSLNGKTIQIKGQIDNHPKYGLQMILKNANQITVKSGKDSKPTSVKPEGQKKDIPVISSKDAMKYVNQVVYVDDKVLKVGKSPTSETYFINYSSQKGGFTVVIFKDVAAQFKAKKMDLMQLTGKKIKVLGKIQNPPQYGVQIVLDRADNLTISN